VTVAVGGLANQFDPPAVTIAAGGTVTWEWKGGIHDVTFDGFHSKTQESGSYPHTFDTPGTYAYVCTVHQSTGMRGTINVR
jgi:plastocyanin